MTPPPATISGRAADFSFAAAASSCATSARSRGTIHVRGANNSSGKSKASACTSCGSATVTAPVSPGDIRTRIASTSDGASCSGRLMRSQNFDTGLKQSFTD